MKIILSLSPGPGAVILHQSIRMSRPRRRRYLFPKVRCLQVHRLTASGVADDNLANDQPKALFAATEDTPPRPELANTYRFKVAELANDPHRNRNRNELSHPDTLNHRAGIRTDAHTSSMRANTASVNSNHQSVAHGESQQ
jgi:hypothetical protein